MTVAEYEVRFTQLSHYAPAMVTTERDRCRRFEEGLHYEIRSRITPGDLQSYQALRAAAIRAERLIKEQERYLATRKSRRSTSSHGGESGRHSGKKRKQSGSTQTRGEGRTQASGREVGQGAGSTAPTYPVCAQCSRRHTGECRRGSGACYNCGEQGHIRRDCPYKKNAGVTISEPTVQGGRGQGKPAGSAQTRGRQGTQGPQQTGQPRVFALTQYEAAAAPEVITGTVLLYDK